MSSIGSGIAAGAAQAAHNAQQLARKDAKRTRDRDKAQDKLREIYETHLRGIEEQDDSPDDDIDRVHIDEQLPQQERSAQTYGSLLKKRAPTDQLAAIQSFQAVQPEPATSPLPEESAEVSEVDDASGSSPGIDLTA